MPERDHTDAFGLGLAREVCDGNPWQTENGIDAIQFQGIDHQMETVRGWLVFLILRAGCALRIHRTH
jgi:hypothetical protein